MKKKADIVTQKETVCVQTDLDQNQPVNYDSGKMDIDDFWKWVFWIFYTEFGIIIKPHQNKYKVKSVENNMFLLNKLMPIKHLSHDLFS